jgi:hypothetical protein
LKKLKISACIILLGLSSPSLAFERFSIGQDAVVACKNLNVMTAPDSFSTVQSSLAFGNKVTILGLEGQFALPDSDFSSKVKLEQQARIAAGEGEEPKPVKKEQYMRAAWVEIEKGQFVSAACLVSEKNFPDQTMEKAEEKVAKLSSGKAKRNFSEDEDGDMRAMRGAAGKAKGGAADFPMIDSLISDAQGRVNLSNLQAFRKSGQLGEFK